MVTVLPESMLTMDIDGYLVIGLACVGDGAVAELGRRGYHASTLFVPEPVIGIPATAQAQPEWRHVRR